MDEKPTVSIVINNYNYEDFLCEAIDSSLGQTYSRKEVIVVDDGSTDNSREIITSYGDQIISVSKENGGQASAFNAGFIASKGEIICFLDSDDYYISQKVSQIVELFLENPNVGWVFHELDDVDSNGRPLKLGRNHSVSEFLLVDYREKMLKGHNLTWFPATSGLCFKRDLLLKVLPMPEQILISADNFLRLASVYSSPGILSPEKLAVHRIHGANLYEFRADTDSIDAEGNIKTSYYLRQRFPETKIFTNRLYSHSVGRIAGKISWSRVFQISESRKYMKNYLSGGAWVTNGARMLYNYIKVILADLSLKLSPRS